MFRIATFTTVVITCMSLCGTGATADEMTVPKAAEKGAMRAIEANAKTVAWIAYPTTTYTGVEYDGGSRNQDGSFTLTYTFHGESDGTRGYFTQKFQFHRDGNLTGIKDGARSWFFAPFTEFELVRGFLKEAFEKDLENNSPMKKLLQNGNGRAVVVGILNTKVGVLMPIRRGEEFSSPRTNLRMETGSSMTHCSRDTMRWHSLAVRNAARKYPTRPRFAQGVDDRKREPPSPRPGVAITHLGCLPLKCEP